MEERHTGEGEALSLIQKGRRGLLTAVFSRLGVIVILFLVQLLLLFLALRRFAGWLPHLFGVTVLIDILMVPVILNSRQDPTAKITWLMVILVMPVFGPMLMPIREASWATAPCASASAR